MCCILCSSSDILFLHNAFDTGNRHIKDLSTSKESESCPSLNNKTASIHTDWNIYSYRNYFNSESAVCLSVCVPVKAQKHRDTAKCVGRHKRTWSHLEMYGFQKCVKLYYNGNSQGTGTRVCHEVVTMLVEFDDSCNVTSVTSMLGLFNIMTQNT